MKSTLLVAAAILISLFSYSQYIQSGNKFWGTGAKGNSLQGYSVAMSADSSTIIQGAPKARSVFGNTGGAWIYVRTGNTWQQQAFLAGSGNIGYSGQGFSVAISADGNTALVGGPIDNDSIGATWVFARNGSNWTQQAKLVGFTTATTAMQGFAVSISYDGNTALIGAPLDNDSVGASYIFVRNGNVWTQQAQLTGAGYVGASWQGHAVSISADGNTALVEGAGDSLDVGAGWVFDRTGNTWSQNGAKIVCPGAQSYGTFWRKAGAISGDGLSLVLTWPNGNNHGELNIYKKTGGAWVYDQTVTSTNFSSLSQSGNGGFVALSYDGTTLVSGDPKDAYFSGTTNGRIHIFKKSGNAWAETFHTYTPPGKLGGPSLGPISVSASGSMVVFGGPNDRAGMGATWAYHYAGGQWTVMGNKLVGDGDVGAAGQGASITITADGRKIISAGAGDNGSSGALWSFIKNGNTWVQSGEKQTGSPDHPGARLGAHGVGISADGKTTVANAYDAWVWYPTAVGLWVFKDSADQLRQDGNRLWADSGVSYYQSSGGCAISDDGLTIAAGNIDDSLDKGGVKVFVRNGNAWVQQGGVLRGSIGEHNGRSLSLSANGNILAMGSFYDTAAFIFRRTGGLWQEEKIITGSSWKFNDRIATSVSDDGNTVAVGCYKDSGDYGVVLIYQYDGNAWNMQGKLRGSGAEGKPGLGFSVSLSGDGNTLVAGGVYDGLNSVNGTGAHGAVWVFKRSGNNWNQYGTKLIPNDTVGAAFVGSAVAITPNSYTIAVGGSGDNGAGANWVFEFAGIRVIKDTIVNATCDNNADGSIIIHAINGVAPYSYHWSASGAANSDTLKNVLPGFYYVTVTDAAGDSSTQSFQVGASGGFTIASTYKAQCGILSTGQIILTATNGTAPYQYNWNTNPAGTDSIASNLVAGTYLYTVTDATGCQITGNSTIPYTAFWTSAYATRANCAANNGSAIINAQGGTSPYTYIWNTTPPQTTANASGLAGGLYQFTVTELTGCQTTGQVQVDSICKSVIEGTVYLDANGNCIRDNNEVAYAGWGVLAQSQSGNAYATSNSLGYYHMEVTGNATYDIKTFSGNSSCFNFNNCDSSHTVQLNNAGDTAGYNIGITWVGSYDLDATLSSGIARPGVDLTYTIYVSNIAPVALSGNATITFVYDADLIYVSSNVAPASHNSGTHTLTWIVPGLLLSNGITSIEAIFNIPSSTPIGELLNAHVSVGPDDADCNTQNNTVDLPMLVRGPFDPNIKECFPDSVINPGDSMLTYTIHFQNTGNDTTRFIIVRDTLSEYVDPATARTIASSLTFSQFIVSEQGILTWIFDPAALPDSASDPVNSHASITYTIMVDKNLTPGTVVNNRASIYFDYNTPVHTNTASNTVTTIIGIAETKANAAGIRIYPNPASSIVTVSVDESLVGSQLTITDVTGRKVKNLQLQSATQNLSIENFASGVYMLMVSNGKQTTTKRLVVGR